MLYKICPGPNKYTEVFGHQVPSRRGAAMMQASPTTTEVDYDHEVARSVERKDDRSLCQRTAKESSRALAKARSLDVARWMLRPTLRFLAKR